MYVGNLCKTNGMHTNKDMFTITNYYDYYCCWLVSSKTFPAVFTKKFKEKKYISSKSHIADQLCLKQNTFFPLAKFILSNTLLKKKRNHPDFSQHSRFSHSQYFPEIARLSSLNRWKLSQGRVIWSIYNPAFLYAKQHNTLKRIPLNLKQSDILCGLQGKIWNKYTKELPPSI